MISPASFITLAALATTATANINFTWVQPSCSEGQEYTGCLKGQTCINMTCHADFVPAAHRVASVERRVTTNAGRCGSGFGNAKCGSGLCCSKYGYVSDHLYCQPCYSS